MRTQPKSKHKTCHRSVNFENGFLVSRDLHLAALAIGRHPNNPPAWAIEACKSAWLEYEIAIQSPSRGPKPTKNDADALEEMALLVLEEGKKPWKAAGVIGGNPTNQARLWRYWKREYVQYGLRQGHLRLNRAAKIIAEKKRVRPFWT